MSCRPSANSNCSNNTFDTFSVICYFIATLFSAHDQLLQYELLSIYGANPNRINKDNHTPYDVAR